MVEQGIILGAYAATASLKPWNQADQRWFWEQVRQLPLVKGLELPLPREAAAVEALFAQLPKDWTYVLTMLPHFMQELERDPRFGLASGTLEGRRQALALMEETRLRIVEVNKRAGGPLIRAVHIPSAPRQGIRGIEADAETFKSSLSTLLARDWAGASLIIEHCDAVHPLHVSVKGFLDLEDELEVAAALKIGITLNWGRSAVEVRSCRGVLTQIAEVQAKGLLRGFVFSGTSRNDPLYGEWQDNHAPIALGSNAVWEPQAGLLTREVVAEVMGRLRVAPLDFLGLKVQPSPDSLSKEERISFLQTQLGALRSADGMA